MCVIKGSSQSAESCFATVFSRCFIALVHAALVKTRHRTQPIYSTLSTHTHSKKYDAPMFVTSDSTVPLRLLSDGEYPDRLWMRLPSCDPTTSLGNQSSKAGAQAHHHRAEPPMDRPRCFGRIETVMRPVLTQALRGGTCFDASEDRLVFVFETA